MNLNKIMAMLLMSVATVTCVPAFAAAPVFSTCEEAATQIVGGKCILDGTPTRDYNTAPYFETACWLGCSFGNRDCENVCEFDSLDTGPCRDEWGDKADCNMCIKYCKFGNKLGQQCSDQVLKLDLVGGVTNDSCQAARKSWFDD